jgi:hypothetical protein
MRHFEVTEDLRSGINEYLGVDYVKSDELGHEMYRLEHFELIANISPEKAKLLKVTLFPEEIGDIAFLNLHKDEVVDLARKLHIKEKTCPKFSWSNYMVRREYFPPVLEGKRDEDIFKGCLVRFD